MYKTAALTIPIGLWNCQSAVNEADFITDTANHYGFNLLALIETWIKTQYSVTLSALSNN